MVAALNPANKNLKLGFEKECTKVVAALNPANENRLKLKQDGFEQGKVLERVAQNPLVHIRYARFSESQERK